MKIFKFFRNTQQKDDILKTIEKHRERNRETSEKIDRMIASLNGETGWLDCECVTRRDMSDHKQKDKNHVSSRSQSSHSCPDSHY